MKNKEKGFTMIEILIVVAIVGILAAIAVPSYQSSIKKSQRADAKAALLGFAAAMERNYMINGTYAGNDADADGVPDSSFYPSEAPLDGSNKSYDLSFVFTATTFTLYAKPKAAMAGDGPFLITHTGRQGWAQKKANNVADAQYTDDW